MRIINQITRVVSVISILAFSVSSWATPQQLLSDFQQVRLNAAASMTNFYMYSGLDLDSRYKQRLMQNREYFIQAFASAEKLANANQLTQEVTEIKKLWQTFDKLTQENLADMEKQGFPNVRLVGEMDSASQQLISTASAARDQLYENSGVSPNKVVKQARELALLMERITSQYAARGTSNLGQVFVGSSEQTLTEMGDEFAGKLKQLKLDAKSNSTEDILNSIQSKWNFIESRIKNYNENAVVFLVVSYNDRIIAHLQELEQLYL